MTTTVEQLIGQTRRHLVGMSRGSYNKLALDIGISATSVTASFDLGQSMVKNAYICIGDEIMFVYEADSSAKTVTVERGQLGTDAAGHDAGTQIECNPRFPKPIIREALQHEIASWPRSLYRVASTTLNVATSSYGVDMAGIPSNFYDILEVIRRPTSSSTFSTSWPEVGYRVERNMATVDYPSGAAMFLNSSAFGGYALQVTYSMPFVTAPFNDNTDLQLDCGLADSMIDIPPFGAAATLLAGREAGRTAMEAQGEARAPVEVAVGATLRSAAGLQAWRDKRLVEEGVRLLGNQGWRRTG